MGLKVGEKLATTVDLSVKIPVAIGGCQTWYPSIQENWDKVKLLSKQLKNITSQIDQITLKGKDKRFTTWAKIYYVDLQPYATFKKVTLKKMHFTSITGGQIFRARG